MKRFFKLLSFIVICVGMLSATCSSQKNDIKAAENDAFYAYASSIGFTIGEGFVPNLDHSMTHSGTGYNYSQNNYGFKTLQYDYDNKYRVIIDYTIIEHAILENIYGIVYRIYVKPLNIDNYTKSIILQINFIDSVNIRTNSPMTSPTSGSMSEGVESSISVGTSGIDASIGYSTSMSYDLSEFNIIDYTLRGTDGYFKVKYAFVGPTSNFKQNGVDLFGMFIYEDSQIGTPLLNLVCDISFQGGNFNFTHKYGHHFTAYSSDSIHTHSRRCTGCDYIECNSHLYMLNQSTHLYKCKVCGNITPFIPVPGI